MSAKTFFRIMTSACGVMGVLTTVVSWGMLEGNNAVFTFGFVVFVFGFLSGGFWEFARQCK